MASIWAFLTDKGEILDLEPFPAILIFFPMKGTGFRVHCHQDLFQVNDIKMLMFSWICCCFQQNGSAVCFLKASVFLIMQNVNKLNGVIRNINRFFTLIICSE